MEGVCARGVVMGGPGGVKSLDLDCYSVHRDTEWRYHPSELLRMLSKQQQEERKKKKKQAVQICPCANEGTALLEDCRGWRMDIWRGG